MSVTSQVEADGRDLVLTNTNARLTVNLYASIPTSTRAAVDFRDVSKRYDDTVALDGVSIDIPIGQTWRSRPERRRQVDGDQPDAGPARPHERIRPDPRAGPEGRRRQRPGRRLLQTSGLPVTARVGELVAFVRRLYPEPLPLRRSLTGRACASWNGRPVETLSGGEGQRLRFAMAIAGDPDLVFLDEPTVGMDVETRRAFWSDIRTFAAEGRTVVFATHYLEEADVGAERIVVLSRGRIVADGSARVDQVPGFGPDGHLHPGGCNARHPCRHPDDPDRDRRRHHRRPRAIRTTDSDTVMRRLFESGLDVRDLETQGTGLEDAFIALTSAAEPAA
jgi:ABC-2 type transport system ATP-binding protein